MALTKFALEILASRVKHRTVLSFGYPDLLMAPEEASVLIGAPLKKSSEFGAAHKREAPMADTQEVFAALGATLHCVDLIPTRFVEEVVDLNVEQDFGQFDVVLDAGTIEHCANIGMALMNAARSVKEGGYVFHSPPLSMTNHGFYNVSPTLLVDFYKQNGWDVLHQSCFSSKAPYRGLPVPAHARFVAQPDHALYFLAQRKSYAPLKWPVQWKYLTDEQKRAYKY